MPKIQSNPINASNGNKIQKEQDYVGSGENKLNYTRTFNGMKGRWTSNFNIYGVNLVSVRNNILAGGGYYFVEEFSKKIAIRDPLIVDAPFLSVMYVGELWRTSNEFALNREDRRTIYFGNPNSEFAAPPYVNDRISNIFDEQGHITGYFIRNFDNNSIERYSLSGSLVQISFGNGGVNNLTYSDAGTSQSFAPGQAHLVGVKDNFGRELKFTYDSVGRRITLTDPAGGVYVYNYNESSANGSLEISNSSTITSVIYPDGGRRIYWYNEKDKMADEIQQISLTGITDENGIRFSSYSYDSSGRAISTEHAGGVEKVTFDYSQSPVLTAFTDPFGTIRTERFIELNNSLVSTGQVQPGGSGCAESASNIGYDTNGNIVNYSDFSGRINAINYDLSRNLESLRVEAAGSAQERRVFTQWHPDWRLSTKVAEPLRVTTSVYNGQPDPFSAGTASCAPSNALLPDGKPIAVLCKRVEQATTDANGGQGFAAMLQSGVPARIWQYSYNEFGQVLTTTNPLGNVTRKTYYSDTSSSHTMGDLQSITNSLGQVTQYTQYDPNGQVLQVIDPNGVSTQYQYDQRQRLTRVSTAGATTRYDYWPTGLLKQVTQPDASFVSYSYDDANRLIALSDSLGNRIDYTLDNSGNRTAEQVKDPGGALARQVSRVMDALNRVQQSNGRE
ncbi:RHS repeat domain-containing protein [Roseateles koreensis]|uniref:RHS repeat protein n=1 Tax=Roseateles koreensis TaxID=2987526 RepID=A0ABT5KSU2_9BURK|nr:RHS repeat protein [Roseateles koreensis]MDC8785896.1 RHS repeat protein [Roseateles koreensis]